MLASSRGVALGCSSGVCAGSVAVASFMRVARCARELISKLASSNMRARVSCSNPASRVVPTASCSRWRRARAWAGSGDASRRARDSARPARGLCGNAAGSWREDAARWADGLDAGDADAELARLSAEIARHDELYYNDAEPEVCLVPPGGWSTRVNKLFLPAAKHVKTLYCYLRVSKVRVRVGQP